MSKSTSKSFIQFYNKYCREHQLKSKVHLLDNKFLKLNADRLEKEDWIPIIKALKNYGNELHSINLYREHLHRYELSHTTKSKNTFNRQEPAFIKEPLLKALIESIISCINNSKILCSLSLEAFPIENYFEPLVNSINNQIHLQHLALPYCNLSEENLIDICKIISIHTGLQTINLTGCGVTIEGAKRIASLIRSQKLVRYGETWKQSLRYRLPQPDVVPGLRRLTLNNNYSIGDEGFAVICYEMVDDLWIRAIDFQNCGITSKSIKTAIELIQTNSILRVLDLRRNDLPTNFLKDVVLTLDKNAEGDDKNVYDWLNSTDTRKSISNITIQQQRVKLPGRICSAPNNRISYTSISNKQIKLKKNNKTTGSLIGLQDIGKPITGECLYRKAKSVIGELERTKDILNNVSNKLSEERNKREALEKEQQKYKDQLHEIRSCLKQHAKIGQTDECSTATSSTETSSENAALTHKEPNTNHSKQVKVMNQNKYNMKDTRRATIKSANLDTTVKTSKLLVNKSLQSAKLFLLIPKQSCKNSFKFVKSLDDKQIISKLNKIAL